MEDDLKPLTTEEIQVRLPDVPGWEYKDNKLVKTFEFESFEYAVNFIVALTPFCNRIDHHPDIHINFRKITFELTRFSIGGKVTERDFSVAQIIENLYRS